MEGLRSPGSADDVVLVMTVMRMVPLREVRLGPFYMALGLFLHGGGMEVEVVMHVRLLCECGHGAKGG